jgi:hypothetical protein
MERSRELARTFEGAGRHHDPGTGERKSPGDPPSYTPAGPGDERDTTVESNVL